MQAEFSPVLNRVVLDMQRRLVPNFLTSKLAPSTLQGIKASLASGIFLVSPENSGRTIFNDAGVNYAFRAWHDYYHGAFNFALDYHGETTACLAAILDAKRHHPNLNRYHVSLLICEVVAQAAFYELTGEFVADQVAFTDRVVGQLSVIADHVWSAADVASADVRLDRFAYSLTNSVANHVLHVMRGFVRQLEAA